MDKVYGHPSTDGRGIHSAEAESKEHGKIVFKHYGPADVAELRRLVSDDEVAKDVLRHYLKALETAARGKAWAATINAAKVTVTVNGKEVKTSKAMLDEIVRLRAELAKQAPKK